MRRPLFFTGVAAFTVVALAGCVRTTVDTTFTSDDTFSQHSVVAFNDAVAAQLSNEVDADLGNLSELLGDNPALDELEAKFPGQIEVLPYDDGELKGVETILTDMPLELFNDAAAQAGTGLAGGATVTRVDDSYVVEMVFPDEASLAGTGVTQSQLDLLAGQLDISVSYTFPGPVESTTAGTVEGHTVTLGLADFAGGDDIRIVGSAGDSFNWQPILTWGGVGLAFVLVIGGAAALIIQDRRHSIRTTLPPHEYEGEPTGPGLLGETPGEDSPRTGADHDHGPDEH